MEYYEEYYYLDEMATIAFTNKLNISVSPVRHTLNIPYFSVYDSYSVYMAKRVAKLHFKNFGIEYYKDSIGKQPWILNSEKIEKIRELLKKNNKTNPKYSNWQVLCFQWNYENGLVDGDINQYFAGNYDNQHFNDSRLESAYVPSTQEMPDTWIYDPSKGKK